MIKYAILSIIILCLLIKALDFCNFAQNDAIMRHNIGEEVFKTSLNASYSINNNGRVINYFLSQLLLTGMNCSSLPPGKTP